MYQQAVEFSPNPVFAVDGQGIIQTWNLACKNLFQYAPHEIIGKPFQQLLWAKTEHEMVHIRIARVFKAETFTSTTITFRRRDNSRVLLHSRFYPVMDADGQPALCSIASTNLTERFELERILRTQEPQYKNIFDASPIGIELFDTQGQLLEANPACLKIFGVSDVADLAGFQMFNDQTMPADIKAKLRAGEQIRVEQRFDFDKVKINRLNNTTRSGQINLDLTVTPISGNRNIMAGYLVQIQDITGFRQTKQQLREREQFLLLLNKITQTALEAPTLSGMLQMLADRMRELFKADSCSVTLWDEKTGQSAPTTSPEPRGGIYENLRIEPDEQTLTVSALQAGRPLPIADVYNTPWLSPRIAAKIPDKSVLAIPLIADGRKLGAAIVGFNEPHQFTQQEIMQAEQSTQLIALAIAKTKYLEDAQARYQESEILHRVMAVINSSLNLNDTIISILEQLERMIPYDSATIQLLHDGYLEIVHNRYVSSSDSSVMGIQFPVPGNNPNTVVVETRQPLLLTHPSQQYPSFKQIRAKHIQCWLGVPLIRNDQVIGIIALIGFQPHSFTPHHVRLVASLADPIAVALENAQLFHETECQSRSLIQILEVSELMHRGLKTEQVLKQITQGILQLGFKVAVLNTYLPETNQLIVTEVAGITASEEELLRNATYDWNHFKNIMQDKFRVSHSFLIQHHEFDWDNEFHGVVITPEGKHRGPGYWHPKDSLMIPLYGTQGNPLGVISVDEPLDGRLPDANTIRMLENFANQATIALENAQLHQQIQKGSITKTTLLSEVNHRVQNNLTAILGLLTLEKRRWKNSDDPATYQAVLDDMFHRINGLSIAHRILSAGEWSTLLLSDLCRQIINAALKTLPFDKKITVKITESPVQIRAKQATHLALIINELTTNTIKYGMQNRKDGHITVNITQTDDNFIILEFRDDGPGYPPNVVSMEVYDIGIQVTKALTEHDLQGSLTLRNDGGAVTVIRFKSEISG